MKPLKSLSVTLLAVIGFFFFLTAAFDRWTGILIVGILTAVSIAIWLTQRKRPQRECPKTSVDITKKVFRSVCAGLGLFTVLMFGLVFITEWDQLPRENESRAIISLKNLATAQITFFVQKHYAVPGNTSSDKQYADNFRNLHYGRDAESQQLRLISRELADAFIVENILDGTKTAGDRKHNPSAPYSGYYFQEDVTELPRTLEHARNFAYMAFPASLGETGRYVFWIGEEGTVYRHQPDAPKRTPAAELMELYRNKPGSSPLADSPTLVWTEYP